MARKFVFAIIVNLPKAPEQQTMMGILVLVPYIILVYGFRPYASRHLNVMDFVGTTMAMSISLGGLVLYGGYDTRIIRTTVIALLLIDNGMYVHLIM